MSSLCEVTELSEVMYVEWFEVCAVYCVSVCEAMCSAYGDVVSVDVECVSETSPGGSSEGAE